MQAHTHTDVTVGQMLFIGLDRNEMGYMSGMPHGIKERECCGVEWEGEARGGPGVMEGESGTVRWGWRAMGELQRDGNYGVGNYGGHAKGWGAIFEIQIMGSNGRDAMGW